MLHIKTEELVTRYSNTLFKICLVILGNEQDVQDAIQETFYRYLKIKPEFSDKEHEKAWFIRVAINICKDMRRFQQRHPKISFEQLDDYYQSPEDEKIVEEIDSRQAEASTYSRELTQEEKDRKKELTLEYQQGKFPEGELKKVEDESKVDSDILCYVPSTGYFYLPDRVLTDEELLQMIDYNEKIDYSLQKRYEEEYAEQVQAEQEAEDKLKQENQEKGGITETEALALSEKWLNKLFGLTPTGLELNYYVESAEESFALSLDGSPVYAINYSIQGVDYYYFYISGNGDLLSATHSGGYLLDTPEISLTEAEGKI